MISKNLLLRGWLGEGVGLAVCLGLISPVVEGSDGEYVVMKIALLQRERGGSFRHVGSGMRLV